VLLALGAAALMAGPAQAQTIHWESVLPDAPPSGPQHGPVPQCRKATIRCIDVQLKAMRRLQRQLGCDHRAVFTTTYITLTEQLRAAAVARPSKFLDLPYLYREVRNFAAYYFRSIRRNDLGKPVPPAWEIAFDVARNAEANAAQDMLLGINAHVQSDMAFVLASMGLVDKGGRSRKPDHDVTNEVLADAYQRVIDRVAQRYDPILLTTNASWNPVEDIAALEMVKGWREMVWRNAERLINAHSPGERAQVGDSIEQQAAMWAQGMAAYQQPGYRATRDAYCAAGPAGKPPKTVASRST
jgi:hypothetical protein